MSQIPRLRWYYRTKIHKIINSLLIILHLLYVNFYVLDLPEGRVSLACCSSWHCKESDMSWWLNNKNRYIMWERKIIFPIPFQLLGWDTPVVKKINRRKEKKSLIALRIQPTRPPRTWDCQGKNTRAGCHFLLQCMKEKSESEVAQSCPTLSDPMDCSLPGSSFHEIFQARVLDWGAIAFSDTCERLRKTEYLLKMD